MSVTPLFSTREDLLKKIRLNTAVDDQTLAVIDSALMEVRLGFFATLTAERCMQIVAYNTSESPLTTEEITKATASLAEVLWVTAKLVEQLPVLFLQDTIRSEFNDEPLTRDALGLSKYKNSLMSRVESLMGRLKSPAEVSGNGQVFSCGAVDDDGEDDPYIIADNFIGNIVTDRGF